MRGTRHLRLQEQQLHEALRERLTERRCGIETLTINFKHTITAMCCGSTITSLHPEDRQSCDCGSIVIWGKERRAVDGAQWEEWAGAFERDAAAAEVLERVMKIGGYGESLRDYAEKVVKEGLPTSWRTTLFRAGGARS
jgi:hypothetical protein